LLAGFELTCRGIGRRGDLDRECERGLGVFEDERGVGLDCPIGDLDLECAEDGLDDVLLLEVSE
jgi:hypothetical protein